MARILISPLAVVLVAVLALAQPTSTAAQAPAKGTDRGSRIAPGCNQITDPKARAECVKAAAKAIYKSEGADCAKIKDKRKKESCERSSAQEKKAGKKKKGGR